MLDIKVKGKRKNVKFLEKSWNLLKRIYYEKVDRKDDLGNNFSIRNRGFNIVNQGKIKKSSQPHKFFPKKKLSVWEVCD